MRLDDASLLDIVNAARLIVEFCDGFDREAFDRDLKTQSSVIHQIIIIGEAVKRLSPDLRNRRPDIPWRSIAGMRDVVIHRYDSVDLDEVWDAVTTGAPELIRLLSPLVPLEEPKVDAQ